MSYSAKTDKEKSYCRCVAHVAAKSPNYNPYAVCTKSVGRTSKVECMDYYIKEYDMPPNEVAALAKLKKKSLTQFKRELSGEIPVVKRPRKARVTARSPKVTTRSKKVSSPRSSVKRTVKSAPKRTRQSPTRKTNVRSPKKSVTKSPRKAVRSRRAHVLIV